MSRIITVAKRVLMDKPEARQTRSMSQARGNPRDYQEAIDQFGDAVEHIPTARDDGNDPGTVQERMDSENALNVSTYSAGNESQHTASTVINNSLEQTGNTENLTEHMALIQNTEQLPTAGMSNSELNNQLVRLDGAGERNNLLGQGAANMVPPVLVRQNALPPQSEGEKQKSPDHAGRIKAMFGDMIARDGSMLVTTEDAGNNSKNSGKNRNEESRAPNQKFSVHIDASDGSVDIPEAISTAEIETLINSLHQTKEKLEKKEATKKRKSPRKVVNEAANESKTNYLQELKNKNATSGASNSDPEQKKKYWRNRAQPYFNDSTASDPYHSGLPFLPMGAVNSSPGRRNRFPLTGISGNYIKAERPQDFKRPGFKAPFRSPRSTATSFPTNTGASRPTNTNTEAWIKTQKVTGASSMPSQPGNQEAESTVNTDQQQESIGIPQDSGYLNEEYEEDFRTSNDFRTSSRTGRRTSERSNRPHRGGDGGDDDSSSISSIPGGGRRPAPGGFGGNNPNNPGGPGGPGGPPGGDGGPPGGAGGPPGGPPNNSGDPHNYWGFSGSRHFQEDPDDPLWIGADFNYLPLYFGSVHFPTGLASEQLQGQTQSQVDIWLPEMPTVLRQALVGVPPAYMNFIAQKNPEAELYRRRRMVKELMQCYDRRNRFIKENKTGISYNPATDVYQDFMGRCLELGRKNKLWDKDLKEVIYAALSEPNRQEVNTLGLSPEGEFGDFLTGTRYAYTLMLMMLPSESKEQLQGNFEQLKQHPNQNVTSYINMIERSYRMAYTNYNTSDEAKFYKVLNTGFYNKELQKEMAKFYQTTTPRPTGTIGWEEFKRKTYAIANYLGYAKECKIISVESYKGAQTQAVETFKHQIDQANETLRKEVNDVHELPETATEVADPGSVNSLLSRGQKGPGNCNICNSPDHWANRCPQNPNRNGPGNGSNFTQNQVRQGYNNNKPNDVFRRPYPPTQATQPSQPPSKEGRMVAASSHNPTPRQNSRFKKSAKEGNATGRKRTFYKVKKKGVNSIDLDGEEYLIVDEGEISEIESELDEEPEAPDNNNAVNETAAPEIYEVHTLSLDKDPEFGFTC